MKTLDTLAIQPTVYYTVEEAAQLLRVSPQTVSALLESRRLEGVRIDEQWRVLGASLLDLTCQGRPSEAELVADWLAVTGRSLQEIWDNDEDAVYDPLFRFPLLGYIVFSQKELYLRFIGQGGYFCRVWVWLTGGERKPVRPS